ncbi:MAG: hypothetical protein ABI947_06700 [Chloroflexota bacterium]
MMAAIKIVKMMVQVGEDRRVVIDLPPETPVGPAEVTIRTTESIPTITMGSNSAREAARAKLLAAGMHVTEFQIPEGIVELSDEEMDRLGQLRQDARPSEELINEDRGEY